MPKTKTGGKRYRHNPHPVVDGASNTICDVTGFRVKTSEVLRRWEGYYVIAAAWHPRQPQDFPVTAVKQQVHKIARKGNADIDVAVTALPNSDFV
jgi:hypothetical protein